jgi:glycosyltransferase involved in cell wall biosynthesis
MLCKLTLLLQMILPMQTKPRFGVEAMNDSRAISVSVIVPARNEAKLLGHCIERLRESLDSWGGEGEIVVIDNGSTDGTADIARERGCIVHCEDRATVAKLRNIGARLANGKILAFVDADCLVDRRWVSVCLRGFEDQSVGAVGTPAVPDPVSRTWVEHAWNALMPASNRPDFVEWLGTSNLMVRRDVFDAIGGFSEDLVTGEDVEFCYRLREKYLIALKKDVHTIHMRESKTLVELFKREYWRGQSTLALLRRRMAWRGARYCAFVGGYGVAVAGAVISLGLAPPVGMYLVALVILAPLALVVKKRARYQGLKTFVACYGVATTYLLARAASLFTEATSALGRELGRSPRKSGERIGH